MAKPLLKLRKILEILAILSLIYCVILLRKSEHGTKLLKKSHHIIRLIKNKINDSMTWGPENIFQMETPNSIPNYIADQWQYFGDPTKKFQMYSAYFDERLEVLEAHKCPIDYICYGSIRVITLMPVKVTTDQIFCNFTYADGTSTEIKSLEVQRIDDPNPINTFMVICVLEQNIHQNFKYPQGVGISYKNVSSMWAVKNYLPIRYPKLFNESAQSHPQNRQLLACVPAFQGNYSNVLRIVEFVELYKILGVTKFYFYNDSISNDVDKILRYYMGNDNVEVLGWKMNAYEPSDIYYEAISACFNDCYYRGSFLDNALYIALMDIDEIMMPLGDINSLPKLLAKIDKEDVNSFSFHNVFMKEEGANKTLLANSTDQKNILYSNRFYLRSDVYPHHIRSKMIGKGKKLIQLSNHFYIQSVKNSVERDIDPKEGLLFHYRDYSPDEPNAKKEFGMKRFIDKLSKNVNQVCQLNFEDSTCKFS